MAINNESLATWLSMVHPHWLEYRDVIESVDQRYLDLVGILLTLVSVVGIIGNVTVILIFARTHSNALVINLAICDLIFSAVIGFPMTALSCFKRRWLWGNGGCLFYAFAAGWTGLSSITSLTFISIDRYMVIVHPLYMLDKKSSTMFTLAKLTAVWTWGLAWSAPPLFGWGAYVPEAFGVSCTFDYLTRSPANVSFNFCLFAFGFFLPVAIIMTSYLGIFMEVVRSNRRKRSYTTDFKRNSTTERDDAKRPSRHLWATTSRSRQELRTAKVLACCVTAFLTCWTPYAVVALLGINGASHLVGPYVSEVPVIFAKTSSIWNPLIYAFSHPVYKGEIEAILARFGGCSLFRKGRKSSRSMTGCGVGESNRVPDGVLAVGGFCTASTESLVKFKMMYWRREGGIKHQQADERISRKESYGWGGSWLFFWKCFDVLQVKIN